MNRIDTNTLLHKTILFVCFITTFATINCQTTEESKEAKAIKNHDRAVHLMDDWMRDPYIMIGPDGNYYLTCTQIENEADGMGVPLYKSKDLVTWEKLGIPYTIKMASNYNAYLEVLKNPEKEWQRGPLRLWAPELYYLNDRWLVVHTSNAGLGNLVLAGNESFEVPFDDWGESFGRRHDPSIFTDDDGSHWLVYGSTNIIKIKPDLSGFDGDVVQTWPSNRKIGHEGSQILKIGSRYVLFGTGWSTDKMRHGTYNLYYCTADKVTGPYDERKFTGRFLGHGTVFQDKEGRWWCTAFYNANVPPLSREEINIKDLSDNAYTINKQGLTIVPLDIKLINGKVIITAKDPDYATPGAEEVQQF